MKIFAIGLGGFGSSIVGELLKEVKEARDEGQELNFDYVIIDFLGCIRGLPWEIKHEKCISLIGPREEWIKSEFEGFQKEDIVLDPEIGTDRRRCYAKATFEWNRRRIENAFYNLLSRFFHEAENVDCWLFTSFDGGTGSGMFIDLAILLKKISEHFEPLGHNLSIYLVGIIPTEREKL